MTIVYIDLILYNSMLAMQEHNDALAFKWLRVKCDCWHFHSCYCNRGNPSIYLQPLSRPSDVSHSRRPPYDIGGLAIFRKFEGIIRLLHDNMRKRNDEKQLQYYNSLR